MVLLTSLFVITTPVQAETAADASWTDDTIVYDGRSFVGPISASLVKDLGLAKDTIAYVAEENAPAPQRGGSNSSNSPPSVYHVIYFATTDDLSSVTTAQYRTYDVERNNTGLRYTNASSPSSITIDNTTYGNTSGQGSCQVPGGVGWVICPVSNFLATAVDWSYTQLEAFLAVQPLTLTNPNDSMYTAWNIARSIANVAFVIAFLIIIYSYTTNLGISNYGLKKMIPRLIIAAVAVNLSFIICAVVIDASNILGYSIQDVLMTIRDDLFNSAADVPNANQNWNWELLTASILGGGVGLGALALATYGSAISFVYMLVPLLIGLALVGLVILLILAARQAIIVILVIIAPLAFVAYLLPNTEKLFERWRGLFTTMLVFFPIFSLVFGGAQLAGAITIQNASSVAMIILGLAIQIAPLVIMPIILRFSGGLLGKIAGIINNPSKGLLDRTKNWSKARQDAHKYSHAGKFRNRENLISSAKKAVKEAEKKYKAKPTAANAQKLKDQRRHYNRTVARSRFRGTNLAARYGSWSEYSNYTTEKRKQTGEEEVKGYNQDRLTRSWSGREMIRREALAHHSVEESKFKQQEIAEVMMAGKNIDAKNSIRMNARRQALSRATIERAVHMKEESLVIQNAITAAQGIQTVNYATALKESADLRNRAGGIDPDGAQRALAGALKTLSEAHAKNIANLNAIMDHANLNNDMTLALAKGVAQSNNGIRIDATKDAIEAAISRVAGGGSYFHMLDLVEHMDLSNGPGSVEDHRIALVDALRKNSGRPKFYGATWLDKITQGIPGGVGQSGVDNEIYATLNATKFSPEVLVSQDQDVIKRVGQATRRNTGQVRNPALATLKKQIIDTYSDPQYSGRIAERDPHLRDLINQLDAAGIVAEGMTATEEKNARSKVNL